MATHIPTPGTTDNAMAAAMARAAAAQGRDQGISAQREIHAAQH